MKPLFKKFILFGLLGSFLVGNSINCNNKKQTIGMAKRIGKSIAIGVFPALLSFIPVKTKEDVDTLINVIYLTYGVVSFGFGDFSDDKTHSKFTKICQHLGISFPLLILTLAAIDKYKALPKNL